MQAGPNESYFMTTQDQDAALGKLIKEQRDMKEKLVALEAEAQRLGHRLVRLGQTLIESPGRIALAGEAVPERVALTGVIIHQSELDEISKLPKLTADYRETQSRLQENQRLLEELGLTRKP